MAVISYRNYAIDLQNRMARLRAKADNRGAIEIAICRNAFCYRSVETFGDTHSNECAAGALNSAEDLLPVDGRQVSREIQRFFDLPEIYAYSDLALRGDRSPLSKAHWDGTVALVDICYDTDIANWHQRMLFIGFEDPIHADFAIALDGDIFTDGSRPGRHLFEWKAVEHCDLRNPSALSLPSLRWPSVEVSAHISAERVHAEMYSV